MSLLNSEVIRAEQHAEVGILLSSNVGIVIDRWARRAVEEQPNAQRVHHDVMLDHMNDLLRSLGRSLMESRDPYTRQHWPTAANHGEQRWNTGWSLPEVVRDYQILRVVILEFLEESLPRPLGHREALAIGLALDESIAASVVTFVKDRENHLLTAEQKRIESLKDMQERLQDHARALQDADHRKNDFLAMLAHELRNPLAPIRNALHILRLKGTADPEQQWAREVIERQAQQMARMVDDLFDISRIARGKVKVEKEPVAVAAIVERALEEVRPIMDGRKHQFTVSVPDEPMWLEGDRRRLTQVLVNILVNAAKYTQEGGQIHLTVERVADEVAFKARDNGIGIPPEFLPHLFDPFAQEEQTEDRAEGGLGIGLALVRNFVELHGGRVSAFSAGRGQGSEFVIHLPLLKEKPASSGDNKKAPSLSPSSSRRVLVVDDNHDAARSLARLLSLHGHEVQTAHDGPTALESARANVPEIILLDIGMPRMDGFEVARRLRQEPNLRHVLLVALTGYGQERDRQRSQEAGFNVHLVKPIEFEHLYDVLKTFGKQPEQMSGG